MKQFVIVFVIFILIPIFWFVGVKGMSIEESLGFLKKSLSGEK